MVRTLDDGSTVVLKNAASVMSSVRGFVLVHHKHDGSTAIASQFFSDVADAAAMLEEYCAMHGFTLRCDADG
jgi:hypothetical protein